MPYIGWEAGLKCLTSMVWLRDTRFLAFLPSGFSVDSFDFVSDEMVPKLSYFLRRCSISAASYELSIPLVAIRLSLDVSILILDLRDDYILVYLLRTMLSTSTVAASNAIELFFLRWIFSVKRRCDLVTFLFGSKFSITWLTFFMSSGLFCMAETSMPDIFNSFSISAAR